MTKGQCEPPVRRSRKSQQPFRRLTRKSEVVKMLNVMAEQSPDTSRDVTQDFLTTGRAGRRNALPDILGEHALVSTSDLPDRLQGLSTQDEQEPNQNTSQISQADSKPSTSNTKTQKKS